MKIVLASESKYRKKQLNQIGLSFESASPLIDEDEYKKMIDDPLELSRILALKKAESLQDQFTDSLIIGSDQLVAFGGKILGQAGSKQKAIEQLGRLQAKEHQLITSTAAIKGSKHLVKSRVSLMKMRPLSEDQVRAYVDADNPVDCAGSYKLEESGISLFEKVETTDPSSIVGMSLMDVTEMLLHFDHDLPFMKLKGI